jgi:hypothetical protein
VKKSDSFSHGIDPSVRANKRNEIWEQDKIYIYVVILPARNMKLVLLYNLNFTKVCTNLEMYVIHWLNFRSDLFI